MKSFLPILGLSFLLVGCNCEVSIDAKSQRVAEKTQRIQSSTDEIIGKLIYMKDPRTGLCFAYLWDGMANGGPALTLVPQESIPTNMLWIANISTNN